jgi:hypothetical protein
MSLLTCSIHCTRSNHDEHFFWWLRQTRYIWSICWFRTHYKSRSPTGFDASRLFSPCLPPGAISPRQSRALPAAPPLLEPWLGPAPVPFISPCDAIASRDWLDMLSCLAPADWWVVVVEVLRSRSSSRWDFMGPSGGKVSPHLGQTPRDPSFLSRRVMRLDSR